MFNWINKLLNYETKAQREMRLSLEKIESRVNTIVAEKEAIAAELKNAQEELGGYHEKDEIDLARKTSKEPWVEITGVDQSDVKGIRIELDWNEAFVEHLKDSGIAGKDEDEIVQKWLAMMYQHLVEKLEEKVVENKDQRGTVRDFM